MSIYLERYAFPPLGIAKKPLPNTEMIVVVPVFNEEYLLVALESLFVCELPLCSVEVIIVINEPENCEQSISEQNTATYNQAIEWINMHTKKGLVFYVKHIKLNKKHAGVGLARKAGMDEATLRFELINNEKGIILCYDADCTCDSNYLLEVYNRFSNNKLKGASINFEHKFDNLSPFEKEGIIQYELHLRYYINALRSIGYPHAFHTIGSSMAVRVDIYKKAGGMNKRKAGEDFHFLHKVIPYQNYEEITSTTIYPSARVSNRVPFGTGKAMGTWLNTNKKELLSYHPQIFKEIAELLKQVPYHFNNKQIEKELNKLPQPVVEYLKSENYVDVLKSINRQSNTINVFFTRWYAWFNGLKILHLVHFLRDNYYPSIPITEAAIRLISTHMEDSFAILKKYRTMDQNFKATQINLTHLYSEFL